VFTKLPVALMLIVPVTVNLTVPPEGMLTDWLMFPEPVAAPQLEPSEAEQLQVTLERAAGNVSVTMALLAPAGPALPTVIV
jgi:hypothetical protein